MKNYAELQQGIRDYTHRADLDGVIPQFIRMAEAEFNRILRTLEMERRVHANVTSEYFAVPNDYLELRNIQAESGSDARFLEYVTPQHMDQVTRQAGYLKPRFFTIVGNEFQFCPAPTATSPLDVEIAYYQRIPVLGATIGATTINTNWVLDKHPDAYLYGSLLQAEAYGYKDARLGIWKQAYDAAMLQINALDRRSRWGGGALQMRRMA